MAKLPTGKGRSRLKSFRATYEVLNYTPADFSYTSRWCGYLRTLGSRISTVLKRTSPDHLNTDMFNADIKSHAITEKSVAETQHVNHGRVLDHLGRMLKGEKARAVFLKMGLLSDVELIDRMIKETKGE